MITFDRDAVNRKYAEERRKRMVDGRAAIRDLNADERFARYRDDPFTPYTERDPIEDGVDVVIVGAGLSGLVTGAKLRQNGIERIRLIDRAGGLGGTWYWNRYPGVMCDVESYVYMPMLEEMGYVPSQKYAPGDEIRQYLESIAERFDLVDDALFQTSVQQSTWDDERSSWIVATDRGDVLRARYLVVAPGILNLLKLPALDGMEKFEGHAFHIARWDYAYTGGTQADPQLDKLADKTVGIIGTGASAIQAVAPIAEHAKHLYVLQRTPSAVGVRDNRPTPPDFAEQLEPGWQQERMDNFTAVLAGVPVEANLVDDGWTHHLARVASPKMPPGLTFEEMMLHLEAVDYAVMEDHRSRVVEIVGDARVAESLKPYYRYLCKRPLFHDEYLPAFNRANVTLVDSPGGIERMTERGVIVDGQEIELDCIVYATGFEGEFTPFHRRAGQTIVGRGDVTLAEKFTDGPTTLHGIMTSGFPNLFMMPSPGLQSVATVNYTHIASLGAEHIAETIARLHKDGIPVADVRPEAEATWTQAIVDSYRDNSDFLGACTPSRFNYDGDITKVNPRAGTYGGGFGDFFGYRDLLRNWRAGSDFAATFQ